MTSERLLSAAVGGAVLGPGGMAATWFVVVALEYVRAIAGAGPPCCAVELGFWLNPLFYTAVLVALVGTGGSGPSGSAHWGWHRRPARPNLRRAR